MPTPTELTDIRIRRVVYTPSEGMTGYIDQDQPVSDGDQLLGYAVVGRDAEGCREVSARYATVADLIASAPTLQAERDEVVALLREMTEDDGSDPERGHTDEWTEAAAFAKWQNKATALLARLDKEGQ